MTVPDKCEFCALRVIFDRDEVAKAIEVEDFFKGLRALQKQKRVEEGYFCRIDASNTGEADKSKICAVNSPYWEPKRKLKPCSSFNAECAYNSDIDAPKSLSGILCL